jgi:hypothetical protein
MTAFDRAWELLKEWTPNWRGIADDLPLLSNNEQKRLLSEDGIGDLMGQGNSFSTFPHPNDERFVVKIPHNEWGGGQNLSDRTGDIYSNAPQRMEEMGFPISSELGVQDEYLVQPRLNQHAVDYGSGKNGRHSKGIANILLNHAFSDRLSRNWGQDETGNWRLFDADMQHTEPCDWWPNAPNIQGKDYPEKTTGELIQADLDKWNIQLPASRMLNVLDEEPAMSQFQSMLEAIEPYSDNPKTVQIDGESSWLEGYK